MAKANAYIFVGIPGIGKSTKRHQLMANDSNIVAISADDIRQEWFGDAAIQGEFAVVYREVYNRANAALKSGHSVIFDNTNVVARNRAEAIKVAKNNNCKIIAVVFENNLSIAKAGNMSRERHVPEWVLEKMSREFETPSLEEGFDEIIFIKR